MYAGLVDNGQPDYEQFPYIHNYIDTYIQLYLYVCPQLAQGEAADQLT